MREQKSLKKARKKFLTKRAECGKIKTRRTKRRVPCKLNNVTNEKHQIWIWLFEDKRSLKRMTVNFFEAWKSFNNMI